MMNERKDRILFIDSSVISEVNHIIQSLKNISIETEREINSLVLVDSDIGLKETIAINNQLKNVFSGVKKEVEEEEKQNLVSLLKTNISKQSVRKMGLKLLSQNLTESVVIQPKVTPAISTTYWENIKLNGLSQPKYSKIKKLLRKYYEKVIMLKIQDELSQVPFEVIPEIKTEFIKEYRASPLSFQEFLTQREYQNKQREDNEVNSIQGKLTEQMREDYRKSLEKKKLDVQKQKQIESFNNYQDYFDMDKRQLEQAKRSGKLKKRKYSKQSRRSKYSK